MTLRQKREIVKRFKKGDRAEQVAFWLRDQLKLKVVPFSAVEQVLRDYMLGKFSLEPKRRAK